MNMNKPVFKNIQMQLERKKSCIRNEYRTFNGASIQIRTGDLVLTKDALCRLSYRCMCGDPERARTVDLQRDRLAF